MTTTLKSFTIDDAVAGAEHGGVEVTITLADDRRRWCFFMTPGDLESAGDFVPGTEVRFHYGASHMIVVSELSRSIIEAVLQHLESTGELEECTRPLD
jgi:hypothetical protein